MRETGQLLPGTGGGPEQGRRNTMALKVLFFDLDKHLKSSSGTSVVAIDNKIEQAMDLVKSHLMYAVREEVEVLKEQIKELIERNSQLEQENNLLKTLASPEQMAQFQAQVQVGGGGAAGGGTGGSPTGGAAIAAGTVVAVVGNPSAGVVGNPTQPPAVANAPSLQGVVAPNSSSNAQNAGASV